MIKDTSPKLKPRLPLGAIIADMRLDRLISNHPQYSQSKARLLLAAGRVRVNGCVVRDGRTEVDRFMSVSVDEVELKGSSAAHYLMLHKPSGYLSATADPQHPTVMELLPEPLRPLLHIAGRLDRSSTGLLILTNDGLWSRRLTQPTSGIAKDYRVRTCYPIAPDTAERFARGIYFAFEGITTAPAQLQWLAPCEVRLTIHEGRYHQIKRMFHAVGNRVLSLHRERMGAISLEPDLAPGASRPLSPTEIASVTDY